MTIRPGSRRWLALAAIGVLAGVIALPRALPQASVADEVVIREQLPNYPMTTCVVGGEDLGKMGPPVNHVHQGRLVRFCCDNCLKEFRRDPAKHLAKIDAAAKAKAADPHAGHASAAASGGPSPAAMPLPGKAAATPARDPGKPVWYCPMHPTYTSDKPRDCPICNMAMEPLTDDEDTGESVVEGYAPLRMTPQRQQLIGVQWGTVEKKAVKKTIRAAGRVDYNERTLSAVNLRFGGWVERLFVNATGDPVRKGEPLFEIYSPDVTEAQQAYLTAAGAEGALPPGSPADAREAAASTLKAARDRLLLWGFTLEQTGALDPKQPLPERVPLLAKADGVVIRRNLIAGTRVEAGTDLYEIADLSTVWVNADIFEYEIPDVKVGMDATLHLSSLPGEFLAGRITYLYPYLNEASRTARVRIEVPNPEGKLKPGMYAQVAIAADLGERVVVDDEAVFDTGLRRMVFVGVGEGMIEPRDVVVGPRTDGFAVILKGLEGGERVVTSANFLVDSESRLKAARRQGLKGGEPHAH